MPYRRVHALILAAGLVPWLAAAEPIAKPEPANHLTLATERVVVFKDGYGLFVKTATGTADADGRVTTDQVPDGAVLGCFWASTEQQKALALRAEWVEQQSERATTTACITTDEVLRANRGRKLTLTLVNDKALPVVGTLVDVLDLPPETVEKSTATHPPEPRPRNPYAAQTGEVDTENRHEPGVRELKPRGGQLLAIDTEHGRLVLPVAQVSAVAGDGLATTMVRRELVTAWSKRLTVDMGKEAAGKPVALRLYYFAEGVRWIPTYRISGSLEDKADIALQGELLNEAEDIADAAVDLVVGVPNFRFKTTASPLTLESTLMHALVAAAPNLMNQQMQYSNASFENRPGRGRAGDGPSVLDLAPELSASGQQDLFVYGAKTLSLKKGARATLPLWQNTAALRHLYTLDVKVMRDARSGSSYRRSATDDGQDRDARHRSPLRLAELEVWHQFELGNASTAPWTTGAALIMQGNLPLGQDMMTYTPAGSSSLLPVTVAVDLCGSYVEQELSRQPNALRWDNSSFALIRKQATITVTNLRKQASVTRITVSLGGKVEKISDSGSIRLNDHRAEDWNENGYREINNHSDLSWELTLEPGATRTLTCEFGFYIP